MNPEDELIDALLKEQARKRDADELLLSSIEKALDGEASPGNRATAWKRVMPLSVAAALAMGGAAIYHRHEQNKLPELAIHSDPVQPYERTNTGVPAEESAGGNPFGYAARTSKAPEADLAPGNLASNREVESPMPAAPATALPGEAKKDTGAAGSKSARLTEDRMRQVVGGDHKPSTAMTPAPSDHPASREAPVALSTETGPEGASNAGSTRYGDGDGGGGAMPSKAEEKVVGRSLADEGSSDEEFTESKADASRYAKREEEGAIGGASVLPEPTAPAVRPDSISGATLNGVPFEEQDGSARLGGLRGKVGQPQMPDQQPLNMPMPEFDRDNYDQLVDQPWKSPWHDPLSTFSIDVDTASYTNLRRMIREGRAIQPDAVRIEECVNFFDYKYPAPGGDSPFAVHSLLATCPWQPEHMLARVAIKGREIHKNARPASNLIFLIDVSGSMQSPDKLPMLKRSMGTLVDSLDERDRVGIVVYAGTEGVVLEPTILNDAGKAKAHDALSKLESGGSTNGGAGLYRAYQMALKYKVDGGVNRVILATDGDFNVGNTGQGTLVDLVKGNAAKNVSLSVLGFGTGNLNDSMLEAITNHGNGNYFYVDGDKEADRIFQQKLTGTLVTIAKDVKIQIEFNPGKVKAYRLIGYANRVLRNQDFNNDKIDAGDIGAGHTVTAFYEVVPVGVSAPGVGDVDELDFQKPVERKELVPSDAWLTLKLRYKHPDGDKSSLIKAPVEGEPVKWEDAGWDFRMASAVALFGMKLRNMEEVSEIGWDQVEEIAKPALADDLDERRAEFLELVRELN